MPDIRGVKAYVAKQYFGIRHTRLILEARLRAVAELTLPDGSLRPDISDLIKSLENGAVNLGWARRLYADLAHAAESDQQRRAQ